MARMIRRALSLLFLAAAVGAAQTAKPSPWVMQNSGTTASLRGIHALAGGIAWASGSDGTILRTEDGGYLWQKCAVPKGAEKLDFRGIWAWDANTAIVMSSGPGDASRLYKTKDGCKSWKLLATNKYKDGFWDGISFINKDDGRLLGDPVDGKFQLFRILLRFGHAELTQFKNPGLAAKAANQGAFAASNSSYDENSMIFGTGGKAGAYVYRINTVEVCADCSDADEEASEMQSSFVKISVPMAGGSDGAGIFSVASDDKFGNERSVVAVGGDYEKPNESKGTAAYSADGGWRWTGSSVPPHGYRSAVGWYATDRAWIAVGTNGSDYSRDDGKTWQPLDDGEWNALSLPYVVGPKGRIAKLADNAIPRK